MDIFRKALLQPGPPGSFALQTVQEAIKPQKQTKLVQDENQLLENILRTLLQELVSSAVQSGEQIMQFGQSIDDGETTQGQIPRLLGTRKSFNRKRRREHLESDMKNWKVELLPIFFRFPLWLWLRARGKIE